jgi:hypothetical protein
LVIWLFAGGGEAELGNRKNNDGIVNFFEKYFSNFKFERITPVRLKLSPQEKKILANSDNSAEKEEIKKRVSINSLGKTGESLAKQITAKLEDAIEYKNPICDVILILDDLDCACHTNRTQLFNDAINKANNGAFKETKRIIAFAKPELEAWIIADWEDTIAEHLDFRHNQLTMKDWLIGNNISFDSPENFSSFDENKKSCKEKLSELLIESSQQPIKQFIGQARYSKASHTPLLLHSYLNPDIVSQKCPLFREFFTQLQNCNIQANLAWLLKNLKSYSVFTELSLNVSKLDLSDCESLKNEVKPDVCIYPKMSIDCSRDILKMSEMPLLAIEILSPTQPVQSLLQKIDCYFKLGIKSCWLVYPSAATVVVYANLRQFKAFSSGEVIDETLAIRFNIADIFN